MLCYRPRKKPPEGFLRCCTTHWTVPPTMCKSQHPQPLRCVCTDPPSHSGSALLAPSLMSQACAEHGQACRRGAFPLPPAQSLHLFPASQLPQSSPDVKVPNISQIAVESFRNHPELVLPKMYKPRSYTKLGLQMLGGSLQLEEMFPHHNVQILFGVFSCTFKRETRTGSKWKELQISTPFSKEPSPSSRSLHTHCPWETHLPEHPSPMPLLRLDFSALKGRKQDQGLFRADT